MYSYIARDKILKQIALETGLTVGGTVHCKGDVRQWAMDLLSRFGGMKNIEIGELMGVDSCTVSQGRKRLQEKLTKNKGLESLIPKIAARLSRIKI